MATTILTKAGVIKLIQDKIKGGMSQSDIAREFDVSSAYVSDILLGRRGPGPKFLEKLELEPVYRKIQKWNRKKS